MSEFRARSKAAQKERDTAEKAGRTLKGLLSDSGPGTAEVQTFLRGLGRSATLGLSQYLQAALMGATNDDSFKDNLKTIRQLNTEESQRNPISSGAGQVAGTLLTGGASAGIGLPVRAAAAMAKPATAIGTTAGMGAVSGFTEKESLQDAAVGGGLGLALGGGGELLRSGLGYAGKKLSLRQLQDEMIDVSTDLDRMQLLRGELASKMAQKGIPRAQKQQIAADVAAVTREIDLSKQTLSELSASQKTIGQIPNNQFQKFGRGMTQPFIDDIMGLTPQRAFQATLTGQDVRQGVLGAGVGAGLAYLSNIDPTIGALAGAGGGLLRGKLAFVSGTPASAIQGATRTATMSAAPALPKLDQAPVVQTDELDSIFDSYTDEGDDTPNKEQPKSKNLEELFDQY